jgi:3-phosphoshikimate 1-carboxyvinyltransferase
LAAALPILTSQSSHPLSARRSEHLTGRIRVPGDKSISHRALILGALSVGETSISGLLEGEDVLATAEALRAMGATVTGRGDGMWTVRGVGVGGLHSPEGALDFGNAGTGVRLMMGVLASQPVTAQLIGDASLCSRPMGRVLEPLGRMGARWQSAEGDRLPMIFEGTEAPLPIRYELPVPSAQVKSAILIAGLNTPGRTTVVETVATRDHTERMLAAFGAQIDVTPHDGGGSEISITGFAELCGQTIAVPADPSSAAFPLVAALITEGSDITLEGVMLNPTRNGLLATLQEMGGRIDIENERDAGGERVADLRVRSSALHGVDVPAARAPTMIDEYPVLAAAAACASGTTRMRGLSELRVKESDRLAAVAAGLATCGVAHTVSGDDLDVHGGEVAGGGSVETHMDHRIAMAFLVLGLAARSPIEIDDGAMIATSFPSFGAMMRDLGCHIGDSGEDRA